MKKKLNDLPVYEIIVDEALSDSTGVRYVSIVDDPAIQIKGMIFKKDCCEHEHNFANYDPGKLPYPNFMVDNLQNGIFRLWDKNETYDAYSHPNCNCFIDNKGEWNVVDEVDANGNVYPCQLCLDKKALWDSSNRKEQFVNLLGRQKIKKATKKFETDYSFDYSELTDLSFSTIKDQQIIVGPALIPNKKIYRRDPETGAEYYVTFSSEVIKKIVNKFNKSNNNKAINVDHSNNMVNAYIQQNWIIEDEYYDKSKMFGFNLPIGTWFIEVKIEDTNFWNEQVKGEGKYGFSVEGILGQKLIKMSEDIPENYDDIVNNLTNLEINELLSFFKEIIKPEEFVIEPKAGESENDFLQRCIPFEINNGYDQNQASAICYNIYKNR